MSLFSIRFARFVCCIAMLSMASVSFATQDDTKDDGAKDTAAKKETAKKETAKQDDAKKARAKESDGKKTDDAKKPQDFKMLMAQWQEIDSNLNQLALRFDTETDEEKKASVKKEYTELIAEAEKLGEQLQKAAVAEYEKAPNKDEQVTKLLVGMMVDHIVFERPDEAIKLSDTLINSGVDASMLTAMRDSDRLSLSDMLVVDEIITRHEEHVADDLPQVKLETSKGDVIIELFENQAPGTVGNFVSLVEKGYYDGITFHRVLDGFMAQGGDPDGDGSGGPGYNIKSEFDKPGARKHYRGVLSMANTGQRDSGGSQFFLTFAHKSTAQLNGKHTVFGRVISGMENVDKLKRRDPSNPDDAKITPDKIVKATVVRKREHEYKPVKAGEE